MATLAISRHTLDLLTAQAEREFPYECCGFVIGDVSNDEVRPVRNIQNDKHSADPAAFPRDARTAYLMDPKEQLATLKEIDER
jgi:proteasome lid subunit RPN8/RPN11